MLKKLQSPILCLVLVAASGCSTLDPYTGEKKISKATKYGVGAAIGCALVGAAESGKRARNAALGCGLAGLGAGMYMDNQEKALRDRLASTGVGVERIGDKIKLIMPGNITFDTGDHNIKSSFYVILNDVATVLAEFNETRVRVTGHTDSTGTFKINQKLSEQRAQSVSNYLIEQAVASGRVNSVGYADRYPISSNANKQGRAQNRRVEIELEAV